MRIGIGLGTLVLIILIIVIEVVVLAPVPYPEPRRTCMAVRVACVLVERVIEPVLQDAVELVPPDRGLARVVHDHADLLGIHGRETRSGRAIAMARPLRVEP
jgi:hypothetical protein